MPALTVMNTALTVIRSFMIRLLHIYANINQLSLRKLSDLKTGMALIKHTEIWSARFSPMKLLSQSQFIALPSLPKKPNWCYWNLSRNKGRVHPTPIEKRPSRALRFSWAGTRDSGHPEPTSRRSLPTWYWRVRRRTSALRLRQWT